MAYPKILEAHFTTFRELCEEFNVAAELVGLTIIQRRFGKEFLNISEEERTSHNLKINRIFTSSDLSDIHSLPSDRENTDVFNKGRKIYIKLSDGETTFSPLGRFKRTAQYGLLAAVDLQDSWAITILENEHGSFKIAKLPYISSIEVDLKLGIISVFDTSQKEEIKKPSSDRSVLPNVQSSGCLEEISTLFTMVDRQLSAAPNPERLTLSIAIFRTLLTLIEPSSRETAYLKINLTSFFNGWDGNPKTIPPALIYVGAIDQYGSHNLDMEARWIIATMKRISHLVVENEESQSVPRSTRPGELR